MDLDEVGRFQLMAVCLQTSSYLVAKNCCNMRMFEIIAKVLITKEYLQLEPIGLVFVFFFALILLIQFVAMLFHRFGTFSHILASTEITYCNKKAEDATEEGKLERDALELVRNLQRLKGADGDYEPKTQATDRRKTIANIEAHRKKKPAIGTLDVAFKKRFFSISNDNEASPIVNDRRLSKRRETLRALAQRRDNVVEERRKSRILTMDSRRHNRTRTSIASDADNQRVFTPNGAANEGFENDNEIYGDPMINRSLGRYSKKPEENINYVP